MSPSGPPPLPPHTPPSYSPEEYPNNPPSRTGTGGGRGRIRPPVRPGEPTEPHREPPPGPRGSGSGGSGLQPGASLQGALERAVDWVTARRERDVAAGLQPAPADWVMWRAGVRRRLAQDPERLRLTLREVDRPPPSPPTFYNVPADDREYWAEQRRLKEQALRERGEEGPDPLKDHRLARKWRGLSGGKGRISNHGGKGSHGDKEEGPGVTRFRGLDLD